MTLILKLDRDVVVTYLEAKNEINRSKGLKRQTDMYKTFTYPLWRAVINNLYYNSDLIILSTIMIILTSNNPVKIHVIELPNRTSVDNAEVKYKVGVIILHTCNRNQ